MGGFQDFWKGGSYVICIKVWGVSFGGGGGSEPPFSQVSL